MKFEIFSHSTILLKRKMQIVTHCLFFLSLLPPFLSFFKLSIESKFRKKEEEKKNIKRSFIARSD